MLALVPRSAPEPIALRLRLPVLSCPTTRPIYSIAWWGDNEAQHCASSSVKCWARPAWGLYPTTKAQALLCACVHLLRAVLSCLVLSCPVLPRCVSCTLFSRARARARDVQLLLS